MTHQECRRNNLPEKLSRFDVGLLVQDGDAEIHEGLGKINHLLPADGIGKNCQGPGPGQVKVR